MLMPNLRQFFNRDGFIAYTHREAAAFMDLSTILRASIRKWAETSAAACCSTSDPIPIIHPRLVL